MDPKESGFLVIRSILVALIMAPICSATTYPYCARVFNLGSDDVAARDEFLKRFDLQLRDYTTSEGRADQEVRFCGSFTAEDLYKGQGKYPADYGLTAFQINGRSLPIVPYSPDNADYGSSSVHVQSAPAAGCEGNCFSVTVNAGVQSNDPVQLEFVLSVTLPAGTFATYELPPNLDFLKAGTNFINTKFVYWTQKQDGGWLHWGGWTDWKPVSPACPAGKFTLLPRRFGVQYMQASFTAPNNSRIDDYAKTCQFLYFEWQQFVTSLRPGSTKEPNKLDALIAAGNIKTSNDFDPSKCTHENFENHPYGIPNAVCSLKAPPSFYDPPNGGYYDPTSPIFDPYPFYYDKKIYHPELIPTCISECKYVSVPHSGNLAYKISTDGKTLSFLDRPDQPSGEMSFETRFVGVSHVANAGSVKCAPDVGLYCTTLYSWKWVSDFDGTAGGAYQTDSSNPIDPGRGTGGVTLTGINGVQLPPAVSLDQVIITPSRLAYSRVNHRTLSGTVTLKNVGTNSVVGPLQLLFTGLPKDAVLSNATANLSDVPYITIPTSLSPGQSVTISVQLKNPSDPVITLTPAVYAGSIN